MPDVLSCIVYQTSNGPSELYYQELRFLRAVSFTRRARVEIRVDTAARVRMRPIRRLREPDQAIGAARGLLLARPGRFPWNPPPGRPGVLAPPGQFARKETVERLVRLVGLDVVVITAPAPHDEVELSDERIRVGVPEGVDCGADPFLYPLDGSGGRCDDEFSPYLAEVPAEEVEAVRDSRYLVFSSESAIPRSARKPVIVSMTLCAVASVSAVTMKSSAYRAR